VWDSAAFSNIFLASSFSCSQAESTPAHTQVTQTVEQSLTAGDRPSEWSVPCFLCPKAHPLRFSLEKQSEIVDDALCQSCFLFSNKESKMSYLRQRMVEEMQMRRLAERTQESYLEAVTKMVKYVGKAPEQVSSEEMRGYCLYLTNEKRLSRSSVVQSLCGLKFFYEQVLKGEWKEFAIQWPKAEKKLPVVLSVEEVHQTVYIA
jgi:hypothetical protein